MPVIALSPHTPQSRMKRLVRDAQLQSLGLRVLVLLAWAWTQADSLRWIVLGLAQPSPDAAHKLSGKRVSLVVDRSWSMRSHQDELRAALHQARMLLAGHRVTVLLTTTPVMRQAPVRVALNDVHDDMLGDFMGGSIRPRSCSGVARAKRAFAVLRQMGSPPRMA